MKKFLDEFKEFINRGNVVDLAVAVVVGSAFTAIVNSVVKDLIMPLISLLTGGIDFADMKVALGSGPDAAAFTYGNLINSIIQFLIVALVVFLMVKAFSKAKALGRKGEADDKPPARTCPFCLEELEHGATRCPHCTSVLSGFSRPASSFEESS